MISTAPWPMRKGGSDWVGARSCSAGTFRKPWNTSTKQFSYSAVIAVTT